MKKTVLVIMLCILGLNTIHSQFWQRNNTFQNNLSSISISSDIVDNFKSSSKNIAIELEKSFNKSYVKGEMRYIDHQNSSYIEASFSAGLHFSFFKKGETFYVGIREGVIYRQKSFYNTIGGELGINFILNKRIVLGVRTTMDYRTDLELFNAPSKFVHSNYVKIGLVL